MPPHTPTVNWEVLSTTKEMIGDFPVITKKLVGHVDNSSYPLITVDIQLTLATPAETSGPAPVIMEFGFVFPAGGRPPGMRPPGPLSPAAVGGADPAKRATSTAPLVNTSPAIPWQQQVLAKGWG